jgi:hypothetical protein
MAGENKMMREREWYEMMNGPNRPSDRAIELTVGDFILERGYLAVLEGDDPAGEAFRKLLLRREIPFDRIVELDERHHLLKDIPAGSYAGLVGEVIAKAEEIKEGRGDWKPVDNAYLDNLRKLAELGNKIVGDLGPDAVKVYRGYIDEAAGREVPGATQLGKQRAEIIYLNNQRKSGVA